MLIIQFLILTAIVSAGVIFFLKKMLKDDTESAINRLNRVYQDLLKRQEELTQKIQTAEKEYAEKKEEAEQIKGKLEAQAVEEARLKKDAILKTAKGEADELVARAHASTEKFEKEIEKKMAQKTIDFVADLIAQVFSERMNEVVHKELTQEFIDGGEKLDLSAVGSDVQLVKIRTALPLPEETKLKFQKLIQGKLGRSVEVQEVIDKAVIAGIVLQFGTLLLDASLPNLLKEAAWQSKKKLDLNS